MTRLTAAACAIAALAAARAGAADATKPRFTHDEWVELVRLYARGDRTAAIAGLGAWSERDLTRQLAAVAAAARERKRCVSCPNRVLDGLPLRAVTMLHWDTDRAEQPLPLPGDVEQRRRCPGPIARLAGGFGRVMSLDPKTADFARRFFRMVVLQCQFDACFEEAEAWAANAIELFPRDGDLLLARGSVREELATIGWARAAPSGAAAASETAADAGARRQKFEEARQDFEDALVAEPGLGFARVRLGRVQWRLGDAEAARRSLEAALTSLAAADHLYLAHLFLGRIHQDAHRLPEAQAEYRLAEAIHPSALSAGTALSNALLVAGEADAARQTLRQGLRSAGRRSERDPLWDYLMLNGADFDAQKEALHREALE